MYTKDQTYVRAREIKDEVPRHEDMKKKEKYKGVQRETMKGETNGGTRNQRDQTSLKDLGKPSLVSNVCAVWLRLTPQGQKDLRAAVYPGPAKVTDSRPHVLACPLPQRTE